VEETVFLKGETAVEIDEEGFSPTRDEDIPLMSQIEVDYPSLVDFSEHLLQVREERRLKSLSSLNRSSWDKFHCKSEAINSLNSLGHTVNPLQAGVYFPFFMNEPESQCPAKKEIFSPNILDHERATFQFHSIQVRLAQGAPLGDRDETLLVFLSVHNAPNPREKSKMSNFKCQFNGK
jgi:hypothetical protein